MAGKSHEIAHSDDGKRGAFRMHDAAELTYVHQRPGIIDANHTWTNPEFRGQGLAGQLFNALVNWARATSHKIIPSCPYIAAKFRDKPELAELLAEQ